MNIHNRCCKIFKVGLPVNFYEVVCAILTLSGTNSTILVNFFFFVTATAVQWRTKDLAMWCKTGGLGTEPPAANRFLRFSHKKH